jgi:hypothetical protein
VFGGGACRFGCIGGEAGFAETDTGLWEKSSLCGLITGDTGWFHAWMTPSIVSEYPIDETAL